MLSCTLRVFATTSFACYLFLCMGQISASPVSRTSVCLHVLLRLLFLFHFDGVLHSGWGPEQ